MGVLGQYKTGIKTRQPPPPAQQTEQLNYNHQYQAGSAYERYNGNYKPAEYYQGESLVVKPTPSPQPQILDATAEFINKTRAGIASGICFKEVPTSTLVKNGQEPVSNGTSPGMSTIQVCCEGYERNPHVFKKCDPICEDDCPNGICVAPNQCVCIPGHVRNSVGKCVTTCPIGCENGVCTDDGQCQCKSGYTLEPKQGKFCVPACESECKFGKCIGPNQCECEKGYRLTAVGTCEPQCENCQNGKCTAPGLCSCHTGYTKVGDVCEPVCSLGCDKGFCIAPDTCSCPVGSELDRSGIKCNPRCDVPCVNGVCSAPNKCECEPGYVPDENHSNMCVPHCPQGCPNGYCSAPNFCSCNPGFIKSGIKGRYYCNPAN
ncbi:epidermal growth factor-like protein [Musca vetustissima]|uniref:epidermal growth factor-like protein n=1 Tax=Musca vetustissima TaxID=27455 RepID=UPI002AB700FA|nr:epidermal growth factor-like protein [Musca vetustissima]